MRNSLDTRTPVIVARNQCHPLYTILVPLFEASVLFLQMLLTVLVHRNMDHPRGLDHFYNRGDLVLVGLYGPTFTAMLDHIICQPFFHIFFNLFITQLHGWIAWTWIVLFYLVRTYILMIIAMEKSEGD